MMQWQDSRASKWVSYRRGLGEGRWDKILKRKLVALSEADNYDEAKEEWKATGRCWWASREWHRGEAFRNSNIPTWVEQTNHVGHCLCGHDIVYHYEIENTKNGIREVVGSDHISSYLILREIVERTGMDPETITEQMIQDWINVRVKGMKAEAWWHEHGEEFERNFNRAKEWDLRINVNRKGGFYMDEYLEVKRPITKIRKKGSGDYGMPNYRMSSIVWRWNHPGNKRNQKEVHGYPQPKLLQDLALFLLKLDEHKEKLKTTDILNVRSSKYKTSLAYKDAMVDVVLKTQEDHEFKDFCEKYGLRYFDESYASNDKEVEFINACRGEMLRGMFPHQRQSQLLVEIVKRHIEKRNGNE